MRLLSESCGVSLFEWRLAEPHLAARIQSELARIRWFDRTQRRIHLRSSPPLDQLRPPRVQLAPGILQHASRLQLRAELPIELQKSPERPASGQLRPFPPADGCG